MSRVAFRVFPAGRAGDTRARHHDQVPAELKERLLGQRPGLHDQVPETTAAGNRLATTIKYLRGAAGIGMHNDATAR